MLKDGQTVKEKFDFAATSYSGKSFSFQSLLVLKLEPHDVVDCHYQKQHGPFIAPKK